MATATPSCRWGPRAGWRSPSNWNSSLTDDAGRSNSATPSVSCVRLPTSTTRAIRLGGGLRPSVAGRAAVRALAVRGLVEPALLERLQHLRRGHRQLGEADARRVLDGVRDRSHRRHDRRLADAAHAVRMARIRDL